MSGFTYSQKIFNVAQIFEAHIYAVCASFDSIIQGFHSDRPALLQHIKANRCALGIVLAEHCTATTQGIDSTIQKCNAIRGTYEIEAECNQRQQSDQRTYRLELAMQSTLHEHILRGEHRIQALSNQLTDPKRIATERGSAKRGASGRPTRPHVLPKGI